MDNRIGLTNRIAQYVEDLTYKRIPAEVIEYTKNLIMDQLGVALAAVGTPAHKVARKTLRFSFGTGEVPVWGSGDKTTLPGAAWLNSLLGSALDLDDGHRTALGHPGAAIIPPAVLLAGQRGKGGRQLLAAVIAGYEVAIRISGSRQTAQLDNVCTGAWSGFGSAMAAAKLLFRSVDEIENVLGLAAMHGPRLPGYIPKGRGMVKEGIPWATMVGIQSALMTETGFSGPRGVFDYLQEYDPRKILEGLEEAFLIKETYIKQFSCCRWIHPVILTCHALREEHGIKAEDLEEVRVKTFSRAARLSNIIHPTTLEDAQFSIPFCCSLVLVKGESGLHRLSPADLVDPKIGMFAEKVRILGDEELDSLFPKTVGTKIEIVAGSRTFSKEMLGPMKGDAGNPLSRKEVEEKFLRGAAPVIGVRKAKYLLNHVANLERCPIEEITRMMASARTGRHESPSCVRRTVNCNHV